MKPVVAVVAVALATVVGSCLAATDAAPNIFFGIPSANRDTEPLYITNREPLVATPFLKLPIGSITPKGWLGTFLNLEADGMTGHLEELSHFCNFKGNAWVAADGEGESGWEEVPYWLKGYCDLGYVLKNDRIIQNAHRWIDGVLSSQEPDGYFGPRANKTSLDKPRAGGDGFPDLWPHMVMLNVLQSFHESTGDTRVVPFMTKYMKWLDGQPAETFRRGYWPRTRWGDNIESIYWLYNRTGDGFLLALSQRIHDNMQDWTTGIHDRHNVNIAQAFREPTIFALQKPVDQLLKGAERNYRQVMDTYGQFPGGGFAGDENCRSGYIDPHQGFETCGMVEFMHSFEMLTKVTGDPVWADRSEDIAFNSLPAALAPDFKALHYLTAPNQVRLDRGNHAPGIQNRGTMFSYSAGEVYRCCQHNVSHGWPYYAEELWLATSDHGLCASLYCESNVTAKVGKEGRAVTISEETDYPFNTDLTFRITAEQPTTFPFYLRIPSWCAEVSLSVNGQTIPNKAATQSYITVVREWRTGDVVVLRLSRQISAKTWQKNKGAVSIHYGPLAFSLKIGENWVRDTAASNQAFPEYEVFPTTPWNYGLVLDPTDAAAAVEIRTRDRQRSSSNVFTPDAAPIELIAPAKKIPGWQYDADGLVGALPQSPIVSNESTETVTLIPMGAARLRISMFPLIGSAPAAIERTSSK